MILNKYLIKFIIILLFLTFSIFTNPINFNTKVKAVMCPSTGPVTAEWTTDNLNFIRSVSLPNINGPIGVTNYNYDFWFKQSKVGGKTKLDYSCDNVVFDFGGNTKYVKEITFQAHDRSDTGGFIIRIFKRNGTSGEEVWRKLDLDTVDGCSSGGDCFKTYTVQINATVTSIIFSGVHDESEKVYLRFLGLKGYGCPSNQSYSCSSDGTKATFSWLPITGAVSYNLRIDRNAPSWFGSEDTADIGTSTLRTFTVTPNVKNTFSVQAIGFDEDYPYGGEMCWQEFTCKSTLPPNNPPKCSTTPISITPDMQYYLPDQQVNISAQGYTDLDNDPITITNWQIAKGTIISKSADSKSIVFKMPNTNNETFNISYTITDGKSNTTCTSQLKTKIAYSCENNACIVDSAGVFATNTDCLANCPQKSYSCNASGQCVYDPMGGEYVNSNCDNKCAPTTVSCEKINVAGTLSDGAEVNLSANVKNFPVGGALSTYQWVSSYGVIDISSDPNCNTSTKICTMQPNKAYTTAQVKYKVPITDTVYFKVNGNTVSACTLNVNNTTGKDININFVDPVDFNTKSLYTISVGTNSNSVLLHTIPQDYFSSYFLKLNCKYKTSGAPCPTGSYSFASSTQSDKTTELLTNIAAGSISKEFVYLNFSDPTEIFLTVEGNVLPSDPSLRRVTTAEVLVKKPSVFNLTVKYSGDSVFKTNNSEYCNENYATSFNQLTANIEEIATGTSKNYDLETTSVPTILDSGLYNLSLSLKSTVTKKEIKCIKVNGSVFESTSVNLNSNGSDINVYAVVGPSEGNTWYEAFGGSAYSKLSIVSNIEDTTSSVLNTIGNIWAGVLQSSGLVINKGKQPQRFVIYPAGSPLLNNTSISELETELSTSSIPKISSLSSVDKDSNNTNFYYFNNNLSITSDFKVNSGKKVPVVFVKGNINIANSVKQLDLILIASGTLNVGTSSTVENDMNINGALLARNNIKFNSLNLVPDVNGKLTEKIYFKPSVYFSNSTDSLYFKNINIYANIID